MCDHDILDQLDDLGYHGKYQVLNAKDYGNIPHGRERIYIVAFRSKSLFLKFEFPAPIELTTKLTDCIDFNKGVPSAYEEFVSIRNRFKNFAVILYI